MKSHSSLHACDVMKQVSGFPSQAMFIPTLSVCWCVSSLSLYCSSEPCVYLYTQALFGGEHLYAMNVVKVYLYPGISLDLSQLQWFGAVRELMTVCVDCALLERSGRRDLSWVRACVSRRIQWDDHPTASRGSKQGQLGQSFNQCHLLSSQMWHSQE